MIRYRIPVLAVLVIALCAGTATADGIRAVWSGNTCGGERMAGIDRFATVSLGQLTVGTSVSGQRMAQLGVWHGESAAPPILPSLGAAKSLPDSTRLALAGLVVTAEPSCFQDRIYAESEDRSSGIALVGSTGETALALEGSRVNLVGSMSTLHGERVVSNPTLAVVSQGDPLQPLLMTNRSVGGSGFGSPPLGQRGVLGGCGLNNVGLLAKTCGLVINIISEYGADYVVINDGSWAPFWETGLRVAQANMASVPDIGSYVIVSGISGVRARGSVLDAVLRPCKAGDVIIVLPPPPGGAMAPIVRRQGQ